MLGQTLVSGTLMLALCNVASASEPPAPTSGLSHWWTRMHQDLASIAEHKRIVPPQPRKVRWRPSRIWSGELDGELVDMVAGDLNGDGKSELYALTTEKLVVFSRLRGLFDVRDVQALPQAPALTRSREPMGRASVGEPGAIQSLRVRTSEQEEGGVYQLREGTMSLVSVFAGYPLCKSSTIDGVVGRNFFSGQSVSWQGSDVSRLGEITFATDLQSAGCSRDTVDPTGHAIDIVSALSNDGKLRLQCIGDPAHCVTGAGEYQGVGYAHLVGDIDNDGFPELISTEASLPHAPDSVRVRSLAAGSDTVIFERQFGGGVVAIAAGDFEGDANLGVVVAVRNHNKVSLWLLN